MQISRYNLSASNCQRDNLSCVLVSSKTWAVCSSLLTRLAQA